jgi:hypothetical protein
MTVRVQNKINKNIFEIIPAFINLFNNKKFIIEKNGLEFYEDIVYYNIYIPYSEKWIDLNYAIKEGFLEPKELRLWPGK